MGDARDPSVPSSAGAGHRRNPDWDEDERAVALDLYLRRGTVSKGDPDVLQVSNTLNARARILGTATLEDFRNPAGVALKLANFAALDPSYTGRGMTRYSRGDRDTWENLSGDSDELSRRVDALLAQLGEGGAKGVSQLHDLEADATAPFPVTVDAAVRLGRRREAGLVRQFGDHLRSLGHSVGTHRHPVEGSVLRVDLIDETDERIWEAKYEVGRNAVRLAIGQLADYRRFEPEGWRTGVLVSRRPSNDLLALCFSVGAAVAWPAAKSTFEIILPSDVEI